MGRTLPASSTVLFHINLEAVFEVAPYRPGEDGRFTPHEEASGFAANGAATLRETRERALATMADFPKPWWVAGGWALDLFLTLSSWDGGLIELPYHQVWARNGPGSPQGPEVFGADPTMLDFLLEQERQGRWAFRRHLAITRALDEFGTTSQEGVPFVRPEVALLFKAKGTRYKDERGFTAVLPHLDDDARSWLASALDETHPGHPWRARLSG